jgi:hypothetical protein
MIILLILNVLSIFICYYIAKSRGAKARFWSILGAIFDPLAIPFVLIPRSVVVSE